MGLFDWVMHGLGFETTEKKDKKAKKDKKNKDMDEEDKYANFNMHEKIEGSNTQTVSSPTQNAGLNNFGFQTNSNIIMVEPKSMSEIQQVVDYLKQGQSVAVNLEGLSSADMERILDFLSGAIYGLNGSIHRWHGDLFLLAPEGHKILRKS